jgi:hypothetical protein
MTGSATPEAARQFALPRGIVGAACLFWGWQTSNFLAGIALALILEAPRFTRFRLEFSETDYRRISDFTAVLLTIAAAIFLESTAARRAASSPSCSGCRRSWRRCCSRSASVPTAGSG